MSLETCCHACICVPARAVPEALSSCICPENKKKEQEPSYIEDECLLKIKTWVITGAWIPTACKPRELLKISDFQVRAASVVRATRKKKRSRCRASMLRGRPGAASRQQCFVAFWWQCWRTHALISRVAHNCSV